jgi:hypothetical protein
MATRPWKNRSCNQEFTNGTQQQLFKGAGQNCRLPVRSLPYSAHSLRFQTKVGSFRSRMSMWKSAAGVVSTNSFVVGSSKMHSPYSVSFAGCRSRIPLACCAGSLAGSLSPKDQGLARARAVLEPLPDCRSKRRIRSSSAIVWGNAHELCGPGTMTSDCARSR